MRIYIYMYIYVYYTIYRHTYIDTCVLTRRHACIRTDIHAYKSVGGDTTGVHGAPFAAGTN